MTPVDTIRPQLDRAQSRAFVIGGAFLVLAAIFASCFETRAATS